MKAVGARSGHIGRLYLAMTLVVAMAATLLGLGPAVLIGRALLSNVFVFLGIHPASIDAPWWTYAVILFAGLGLAPLMALVPIVRTSQTSVRAAIDYRGGSSRPSRATDILARLSRIRRLDRGLLIALRNTVRRPARFFLSAGLLAVAGNLVVSRVAPTAGAAAIAEEQKAQQDTVADQHPWRRPARGERPTADRREDHQLADRRHRPGAGRRWRRVRDRGGLRRRLGPAPGREPASHRDRPPR